MDGYHKHEKGGEFVTYERLRAMGTNGFQEPAIDFKDGKIVGTKRLYRRRQVRRQGRQGHVHGDAWRGLQAPGKEAEKDKFTVPDQQRPHQPSSGRTPISTRTTSSSWTAGPIPSSR